MRKTLSLVLAVLMVLALLPAMKLNSAVAEETAKTYTLVTSEDDLTAGDSYLIAGITDDGDGYVLSKDRGSNRLAYQVEVTDGSTIALTSAQIAAGKDDELAFEILLGGNATDGWSFYDSIGKGYLYAASSSSNQLKLQSTNDANGLFSVSFSEASAGALTVVAKGTNTRNYFRFNSGNNPKIFSCYAETSSVQNPIYLFKLTGGTTPVDPDPTTYEVSFDANGGTGEMASVTTTSPYRLPECGFTAPESKVFSGWAMEGVEAIYNVNDEVELTGDTTFYAQWQDAPVFTDMELVTELADGDEIVIYYPDSSKVVTGKEYYFEHATDSSKNKWELIAADATLTEGVLAVPEDGLVLTVSTTVADDEETTLYTFKTADDKYLYADATDVKLAEAQGENTLFQLEAATDGFYIKCDSATDANSNAIYIEYYKGYFTVYKMATAKYYTFQFFAESEEPEEPPVIEPTGDTIILFTNDVHCGIEDGWGYAGLAKVKKDLEAAGNEVILVDAGDHAQGGNIGTLSKGEYLIDIMNFVGYDLAIPGNHEFDYDMNRFLNTFVTNASYPYISANFMDLTSNKPVLDAYKIFEANGKKIAFVGLSTPETITKSTPTYFQDASGNYIYGFCQDSTGEGVYTAAQNAIDAAKAEGADYVIIVGHMGIDEQSQPWTAPEVIANTSGAIAFIDGHSHSVINAEVEDMDGNTVLHGQTGTKLANIGKLTIAADGTITMELLPAPAEVEKDAETDAYIQEIKAQYQDLVDQVVAYTDHLLTTSDPETGTRWVRSRETNLGDLCADAYLNQLDADIAFVNGGGVRKDIKVGDITLGDILNVHPFNNMACLVEVTGQQILDALEHASRNCPGENGGFLQVAGLTYEIHTYLPANCTTGSDGMWTGTAGLDEYRVKNVQVMNKETGVYEPLDLEKIYTLASHNYMLKSQGDGFAMFGVNNVTILRDEVMVDNQVLINYIQTMPTNEQGIHVVTGYNDPEGEGRIVIVPQKIATFYGEDVMAADVAEYDGDEPIYRYDIKVKNIDPETSVVGIQTFLQYDSEALAFVEAVSAMEGTTGVNDANGVISFAWASNGDGVTIEDDTVVVSLYFKLIKALNDGDSVEFAFVPADNGAVTGYSFVSDTTVVEAENVACEGGTMTFSAPSGLTLYGEDVMSADVMVVENGERLYRYDIRVKDLPEAGIKVNSAQIFLTCDAPLAFRRADGPFEWTVGEKGSRLMFVWASDTPVLLSNEDVILSIYFAAPAANGEIAKVAFTTNTLNTASAVSVLYGGTVYEFEAATIDGSITFGEVMLGDANCDGQITAADAALILRSLVGLNELTEQGVLNGDVDGDGEITAEDAAIILRYIVKLIDKFPVEE